MKRLTLLILILILFGCKKNQTNYSNEIDISLILSGEQIKESGKKLISLPEGLIKINGYADDSTNQIIIAVHGYKSEGYEWVYMLNEFSKQYSNTYFYRYDWNNCPDQVGKDLAHQIDSLINVKNDIDTIELYGHSYGGLVVTYSADFIQTDKEIEINTIAAPLKGYPRIFDKCDLEYVDGSLYYSEWGKNITHHQWRTQKEQDGAYRDLDFDPQQIYFSGGDVTTLPDSMDGHRLGHNWSVNYVTDQVLHNE